MQMYVLIKFMTFVDVIIILVLLRLSFNAYGAAALSMASLDDNEQIHVTGSIHTGRDGSVFIKILNVGRVIVPTTGEVRP
jgi:hypothetical protein